MPLTVHIGTLQRAAQALGGSDALAVELGVSPRQLDRWLAGEEAVPDDIFLRAVDLIEMHEGRGEQQRGSNDTQHRQR
jgi:hypothetical protein